MRLGQLARKYGISKKEIISYLNEKDPSLPALGQNTKLDENTLSLIAQRFEDPDAMFDQSEEQQEGQEPGLQSAHPLSKQEQDQPAVGPQASEQGKQQDAQEVQEQQGGFITRVPEDAEVSLNQPLEIGSESTPNSSPYPDNSETSEPPPPSTVPRKEDEVIATDKLLELLESEEESVDLSKITLIKAPKKELDGLKVVGKIELPEPIKKASKDSSQGNETKKGRHGKDGGRELTEEEREKRRLKAKRKKETYLAREEKRRKDREKRHKKEANKARYQQKLQRTKVSQLKQKSSSASSVSPVEPLDQTAPPKTLLGKVWRWLTTY